MAETANNANVETNEVSTQDQTPVVSEAQINPEKFLKEFNWHNYQEGIDEVDGAQLEEFEKLVAENFFLVANVQPTTNIRLAPKPPPAE